MRNEMIAPLCQWLKDLSVAVPASYLNRKLSAHPEFPSLVSITDVLDDLGIENGAYVVNRNDWSDLPLPFLAHTDDKNRKLVIVSRNDKAELEAGGRLEKWNGIAVFAEKPVGWKNEEVDRFVKQEKRIKSYWIVALSALLLLAVSVLIPVFSLNTLFLLLTTIAGLALSVLIVQKELGFSNELTELLCGVSDDKGCEAVMGSKGSKIFDTVRWSDAGIIYFSAYSILLLSGNSLLPVLTAMVVPFTLFSVYYQWRVVKKWCTLCLLTLAVILLQAGLQWPSLNELSSGVFNISPIAFAGFAFLCCSILWLGVIRPLLKDNRVIEAEKFRLLRFRNNSSTFLALRQQQRKVDVTPWEHDIQLGDPDSALQVMVACNPYCGPCAKTHHTLHALISKNKIGLTVRFSSDPLNQSDRRTEAVRYLLQLLQGKSPVLRKEILRDWYEWMDMEKFSAHYPIYPELNVDRELRQHQQWIDDARVAYTPTIFINGYELPKEYAAEDLAVLLYGMNAGILSGNEMEKN
jgi:uncharacterized membrane protein